MSISPLIIREVGHTGQILVQEPSGLILAASQKEGVMNYSFVKTLARAIANRVNNAFVIEDDIHKDIFVNGHCIKLVDKIEGVEELVSFIKSTKEAIAPALIVKWEKIVM